MANSGSGAFSSQDVLGNRNTGSGYYSPPEIWILQGECVGLDVRPVFIITQAYFLVRVIPEHVCYVGSTATICDPLIAGIKYTGRWARERARLRQRTAFGKV